MTKGEVCVKCADLASQLYYRGASGALILCDVTRQQTVDAIEKWKEDLDTNVSVTHAPHHTWLTF